MVFNQDIWHWTSSSFVYLLSYTEKDFTEHIFALMQKQGTILNFLSNGKSRSANRWYLALF
jgi:hypothetical protein